MTCADGDAVAEPDRNTELVEDCRTLLAARDFLASGDALNWSADTPIEYWKGDYTRNLPAP